MSTKYSNSIVVVIKLAVRHSKCHEVVMSGDLYRILNMRVCIFCREGEPPAIIEDYDAVFGEEEPTDTGEAYVTFNEDVVSDQQTETDVRHLEGKHKMSVQQMKETVLGSVSISWFKTLFYIQQLPEQVFFCFSNNTLIIYSCVSFLCSLLLLEVCSPCNILLFCT